MTTADVTPAAIALRLEIDGLWTGHEFAALLHGVARLYDIRLELDDFGKSDSPISPVTAWARRSTLHEWQGPSLARLAHQPTARVLRIHFGSPGFVDVAGFGKAMEQVRLFLEFVLRLAASRRHRELQDESLEQDVLAKRLENARRFIEVERDLRQIGFDQDSLRKLLIEVDDHQATLLQLAEGGKLVDVEVITESATGTESDTSSDSD